ncbi:MAG: glycosyltransferase family 4 protein [Rickettsiales bacterium]
MTVLNLMLGKQRGGLEQAALDYAEALKLANIPSITIVAPDAWVQPHLTSAGVPHETLTQRGAWDIFAARRLRILATLANATAIICHGNRALSLALRALKGDVPILAVSHNYSTRRFVKADTCLAITQHLARHLKTHGAKNITLMPNMVRLPATARRPDFRSPPVIGTLGRLVAKKGFKNFIEAMSVLRTRNIEFRAILAGDGEEAETLDAHIARYQLEDIIARPGWVTDRSIFFESIDLFALPSLHEPFGIALIEAMSAGVPVISTDSEGPSEILTHNKTGLITKRKDPEAMADAIQELLADHARAAALGQAGAAHVASEYSMQAMATRLQSALAPYMAKP